MGTALIRGTGHKQGKSQQPEGLEQEELLATKGGMIPPVGGLPGADGLSEAVGRDSEGWTRV